MFLMLSKRNRNEKYFLSFVIVLNTALRLNDLPPIFGSSFEGSQNLYFNKIQRNNRDIYYVNNAAIIQSRSDIQIETSDGDKQVHENASSLLRIPKREK